MKLLSQYIFSPVAIVFAITVLVLYILWIQLNPPHRKVNSRKRKVKLPKLADWNLL